MTCVSMPLPCFVVQSNAHGNNLTVYQFPCLQLRHVRLSIVSYQATRVQVSFRIKLPAQVAAAHNFLGHCYSHLVWGGHFLKDASEARRKSLWMLLADHGCYRVASDKVQLQTTRWKCDDIGLAVVASTLKRARLSAPRKAWWKSSRITSQLMDAKHRFGQGDLKNDPWKHRWHGLRHCCSHSLWRGNAWVFLGRHDERAHGWYCSSWILSIGSDKGIFKMILENTDVMGLDAIALIRSEEGTLECTSEDTMKELMDAIAAHGS